MSAKQAILEKIAGALNRPSIATMEDQPQTVADRIKNPKQHTLPAIQGELIERAIANMESVLMSVVRLQTLEDCVDAVQWYLESEKIDSNEPGCVTVAPALDNLQWPEPFSVGAASGHEKVSITPCLAAVAETGSLVTCSSQQTPATLNFLPETHIIIAHESQLVRHVDDVFPHIRRLAEPPRAINFVTGPSRTADIEQTLEIGAHGPRRMHVLLVAASHEQMSRLNVDTV